MTYNTLYRKQVTLLVKTLPHVAQESCFALKGGTAINLFIRDLPRLSVDIDLTYLPIADRTRSLNEIDAALKRIAQRIEATDSSVHVTASAPKTQKQATKLIIRTKDRVQIKIEVTPVLRGSVYEPEIMQVSEQFEDEYGFAEIKVLPFADLYAGKILAALDRQHPRDLFDVHQLYENEGINDEMRAAMVVYLISHDHSPHSLLKPVLRDVSQEFAQNFVGMTKEAVALETLYAARARLINDVNANMPLNHKAFLYSFYARKPDWSLLEVDNVQSLPAVRWRELNLDRSGEGTSETLLAKLKEVIDK